MIWVPAQLVGAYHGDTVTLTCFVEAHPTRCTSSISSVYKRISTFYTSLNYWEKDGAMIHANEHYAYTQEQGSPVYKVRAVKKSLKRRIFEGSHLRHF